MKMRVKLRGVIPLISAVAIMALLSFVACNGVRFNSDYAEDQNTVEDEIENILNPVFNSVGEVRSFQSHLAEEYDIDETFRTMPEDILINVAQVCINKYGAATKKEIVREYRANASVYDNLSNVTPDTIPAKAEQDPVMEEPAVTPAPLSTSYHYEVDTVNGKPVKVLVKEEIYESK